MRGLTLELEVNGVVRTVQVDRREGRYHLVLDGAPHVVDAREVEPGRWSLLFDVGAGSHEILVRNGTPGTFTVLVDGAVVPVGVRDPRRARRGAGALAGADGPSRVTAPMPGKIVRVLVAKGDRVTGRQPLVVVEAMKMENELRAPREGSVLDVLVREGMSVEAGAPLVVIG